MICDVQPYDQRKGRDHALASEYHTGATSFGSGFSAPVHHRDTKWVNMEMPVLLRTFSLLLQLFLPWPKGLAAPQYYLRADSPGGLVSSLQQTRPLLAENTG